MRKQCFQHFAIFYHNFHWRGYYTNITHGFVCQPIFQIYLIKQLWHSYFHKIWEMKILFCTWEKNIVHVETRGQNVSSQTLMLFSRMGQNDRWRFGYLYASGTAGVLGSKYDQQGKIHDIDTGEMLISHRLDELRVKIQYQGRIPRQQHASLYLFS